MIYSNFKPHLFSSKGLTPLLKQVADQVRKGKKPEHSFPAGGGLWGATEQQKRSWARPRELEVREALWKAEGVGVGSIQDVSHIKKGITSRGKQF